MAELHSLTDPSTLGDAPLGPVSIPRERLEAEEPRNRFDIILIINGHGELVNSLREPLVPLHLEPDMNLILFAYATLGKCAYDHFATLYSNLREFLNGKDLVNLNLRQLKDTFLKRKDAILEKRKQDWKTEYGSDDELDEDLVSGWNVYTNCVERKYTLDRAFVPPGVPYRFIDLVYDGLGVYSTGQEPIDLFRFWVRNGKTITRSNILNAIYQQGYRNPLIIDLSCAAFGDESLSKQEIEDIRAPYQPSERSVNAVLDGDLDVIREEKAQGRGGLIGGKKSRKKRKKNKKSKRKLY